MCLFGNFFAVEGFLGNNIFTIFGDPVLAALVALFQKTFYFRRLKPPVQT
jgi:hypothetical protein